MKVEQAPPKRRLVVIVEPQPSTSKQSEIAAAAVSDDPLIVSHHIKMQSKTPKELKAVFVLSNTPHKFFGLKEGDKVTEDGKFHLAFTSSRSKKATDVKKYPIVMPVQVFARCGGVAQFVTNWTQDDSIRVICAQRGEFCNVAFTFLRTGDGHLEWNLTGWAERHRHKCSKWVGHD